MMAHGCLSLLIAVFILSVTQARLRQNEDSCTEEYAAMEGSTMCVYPVSPDATDIGVSEEDIATILAEHNRYRSTVDPAPTNMVKMYWDANIAVVAQQYASHCPSLEEGHDENRKVAGYGIGIGQNMARGQQNWTRAVGTWYKEIADYTYGGASNRLHGVGHYTQVINNRAIRIGCGYAMCPVVYFDGGRYDGHMYVCNYAFGQTAAEMKRPYEAGTSCGACPDHCSDNLCDCGDKICWNGGTLNLATCECECKLPFVGRTCQQTDCPAADKWYCNRWEASACDDFTNRKYNCPWKCGVCTQEGLSGPDDEN